MSGEIKALVVEVSAFGKAPDWSRFQIIGPDGAPLVDEPPTWTGPTPWRCVLDAPAPGRYRIQISPGGAYAGDDEARIAIPDGAPLRVCWRLQDQPPAGMSGWTRSEQDADLTVMAATREDVPSGPVLLVGSGVPSLGPNQVVGFQEGNPLLHAINLDVVEAASIAGGDLPPGFEPVLSGMDGVWVAERSRPPGVYVPGLPAAGGDAEANLRTTLFFNGLRRLLAARAPLDLYGLTSPAEPEPLGTRLALHPDEGRTDDEPRSQGGIGAIRPLAAGDQGPPWWPLLLAAASWIFAGERLLAAFDGTRWA